MKKMSSSAIRQAFLDYFKTQGHQILPSSSLLPANDPTLLFTNAGMVQFKDVFLGTEQRPYTRATTVQRCLRAGGKHNDLENVGFTARHHTFFEMLGNFSFGDYFKSDAIRMAWTFLTEILAIPQEKLWVTVYEDDLESEKIWLNEIGVDKNRLTRCGAKDNFWAMGDTGPCGPCTEIYYDHGANIPGGPPGSPDMDGDRYVEIWNVVFMQYNRDPSGQMHPLPKPSVDTGMGLERIAAVLQSVTSNYDIDLFLRLRAAIQALKPDMDASSPSILVIADHIRSCVFLLADGVLPGNEGRAYVLRRIIRRAVRHGHRLGLVQPFMSQLVAAVIAVMGEAYPHLLAQQSAIEQVLLQEEEQFIRTIHQGLKLLEEAMQSCTNKMISGALAFKLYDTYGFPVDLTADAAREQGFELDMLGFEAAMTQQRQQSQLGQQFQADFLDIPSHVQASEFKGYESTQASAKIEAILYEQKPVNTISQGQQAILILSATPFYAESGGQLADTGQIISEQGIFEVTDTQRKGQLILHFGYVQQAGFHCGDTVEAKINLDRRQNIRCNHTATHILHAVLRERFGSGVQQKGSLVNDTVSRFDFSFNRGLTATEITEIEQAVNQKIRDNLSVDTEILSLEQAQAKGAMALFGEKYADKVRVLNIDDFSMELCGGTHVQQTGEIGSFRIITETSIASGVRRIEFVTAAQALAWNQSQTQALQEISRILKCSNSEIQQRLEQQLQLQQEMQTKLAHFEKQTMIETVRHRLEQHHLPYVLHRQDDLDAHQLRMMMDAIRDLRPELLSIIISCQDQRLSVLAYVPKPLQAQLGIAADWVRLLCNKGGGRPEFAQGGGEIPTDLAEKIQGLEEKLSQYFSATP